MVAAGEAAAFTDDFTSVRVVALSRRTLSQWTYSMTLPHVTIVASVTEKPNFKLYLSFNLTTCG